MEEYNQSDDFSILVLQDPVKRVEKIKTVMLVFVNLLLLALLVDQFFMNDRAGYEIAVTIGVLVFLYSFINSDTSNIVAGMLVWTVLLLACYVAWKNDGLYDTAILSFPCIMIFGLLLGGRALFFPLVIFMMVTCIFLAYAYEAGLIASEIKRSYSMWSKAFNMSLILIASAFGIHFFSMYVKRLIYRLRLEVERHAKTQKEIHSMLRSDRLTALPNESVCEDDLETLLRSHKKDDMIAFITLGLRKIEWLNSTLGHEIGDQVTIRLTERLGNLMDDKKQLYRASNNEFIIIYQAYDYEEIAELCHQILVNIYRPIQLSSYEVEVAGCLGIALAPFDGTDFMSLRKRSHTALSRAKEEEMNSFKFFEMDMEQQIGKRIAMVRELHLALEHKEFKLYYQPKVNLATQKIVGAEALIRWEKIGGTIVPPGDFIPVAEESGVVTEIGKWALEQACRDCHEWHSLGYTGMSVAVNLSPVQFRRGNLPSIVFRALKRSELEPYFLELEITESMFIDDSDSIKEQIYQIVHKGVTFAIDDFGTGYSNLNYLNKFNASTLKIDMSFVRRMLESTQNSHIVNAIIKMSQEMELENVAEGIEDSQTMEKLRELGCTFGQGYFWSKPLPFEQFCGLLEENMPGK